MTSKCAENCEGTLVISCGVLKPEQIICKILNVESLPASSATTFNIQGYPWKFETKYYSAEIIVYPLSEKLALNSDFTESIQAALFYYDGEKQSSFDDVISWQPVLKEVDAEIKLLVCENCLDESSDYPALSRKNILKWCVENHYELVELNPPPESEDEENESFPADAKGYSRVIEALQTHTWANLVMKKEMKTKAAPFNKEITLNESEDGHEDKNESACSDSMLPSKNKACQKINVDGKELDLEEEWLNNVLSGEDPGGESFEALFSRFASMKDKAEGLTGEDRKKYAEKVAIAFWRAMGGDEDEIEGLDDID